MLISNVEVLFTRSRGGCVWAGGRVCVPGERARGQRRPAAAAAAVVRAQRFLAAPVRTRARRSCHSAARAQAVHTAGGEDGRIPTIPKGVKIVLFNDARR